MVVVRESPGAKLSPDKNATQWPPRSPFQALLSSPSGRRKWRDNHERERGRDASPSPVKRRTPNMRVFGEDDDEEGGPEGEDDDEETLRLQLQEIQAKLKLKKLQKTRQEAEEQTSVAPATESRPAAPSRVLQRPTTPKRGDVQVPISPARDRAPLQEHVSPARKRLGLDATFKAEDVSLKRARDGTHVTRSDWQGGILRRDDSQSANLPKPTSFSERLNRSRTDASDRIARRERVEKARSTGFGSTQMVGGEEPRPTGLGARSASRADRDLGRPSSAHQLQPAIQMNDAASVTRSASMRAPRSDGTSAPRANGLFAGAPRQAPTKVSLHPSDAISDSEQGFDLFSQIHLSKRHIPHIDVARAMEGKEVYDLPRLLKEVKAPHYDPPDCESDFVVFAVLASKSSPFDQKAAHRTNDENAAQEDATAPRNKFMVLHLCDLKWEVDCFLFGSAFDQFWKLTPGTLLALLNPGVMPPKGSAHSGAFSLKLGSSEDCVMEIGLARDLGHCTSVKKDGQVCGSWVDARHSAICDFHLNLLVDRNRKHRMEVNGMWRGHAGGGNDSPERSRRGPQSSARERGGFDANKQKKALRYHREYGELFPVPGSGAAQQSAARLLDAEELSGAGRGGRDEASRKRIAAAERERELARQLGAMGGVGAEYLRVKHSITTTTTSTTATNTPGRTCGDGDGKPFFEKPSAAELGLLGKRASDQRLSPAKDRRRHFGLGAVSSAGKEAIGWGGARKAGLLQPKENESTSHAKSSSIAGDVGQGQRRPGIVRARSSQDAGGSLSSSPSKKRARFALDKGIREPGRESLGGAGASQEEDDDLDIV